MPVTAVDHSFVPQSSQVQHMSEWPTVAPAAARCCCTVVIELEMQSWHELHLGSSCRCEFNDLDGSSCYGTIPGQHSSKLRLCSDRLAGCSVFSFTTFAPFLATPQIILHPSPTAAMASSNNPTGFSMKTFTDAATSREWRAKDPWARR